MNHNTIESIRKYTIDKLKTLDETDICFVHGFYDKFDKSLGGLFIAIKSLEAANISKTGLNIWKEAELMGELCGSTMKLLYSSKCINCKESPKLENNCFCKKCSLNLNKESQDE